MAATELEEEGAAGAAAGTTPRMTTVTSPDDFYQFLQEDDRLCVVKFHASWCKSCQKFGLKFKKLARDMGDKVDQSNGLIIENGDVRFAEIEFMANAKLCRSLGIKRLPYVHFYRGKEGLLADFSCGPSKFPKVLETVNEFLGRTSSSSDMDFDKTMAKGEVLGDQIVAEIQQEENKVTEDSIKN